MKQKLLILLLVVIGGIVVSNKKIDSLSWDVNTATSFLEVRPGSNKSNNTLTRSQLVDMYDLVEAQLTEKTQGLYDIDSTGLQTRLDTIGSQVETVSQSQFDSNPDFYYDLYEDLFQIYAETLESRSVEGRGIWHRPFETNLTEVRTTLQALSDIGINMLYVETFWLGRLIYDSDVPNTFQHYFTAGGYSDGTVDYGTDLLEAFIQEGKNYGIEVHAWVEDFFVGYGTSYTASPILKVKPEWANINYDGTIPQKKEVNYLFMDPANPEVRDYLKDIYSEIALEYEIASIHLDYIRYPVVQNVTSAGSTNKDNGYTEYAIREFMTQYGYTGDLRELVVSNNQVASDWQEYKQTVITDFVKGVYYRVKNANPDVYLSTAIFGNVGHALEAKMQDWTTWLEEGYVEMILPMAYYQSSITVRSEVQNLTDIVDMHAFSYGGIAPSFMGYNDHLNTTQIEAALEGNAMGATFFASQQYLVRNVDGVNNFNEKARLNLQTGVYRNNAINPHADTTLVKNTIFDTILDKATRIYIPASTMDASDYTALETALQTLRDMPNTTKSEIDALNTALSNLNISSYVSGNAVTRVTEDINYLQDILTIKSNRLEFDVAIDITVNPDPNVYFEDPVKLEAPVNAGLTDYTLTWDTVEDASKYQVIVNGDEYIALTNTFDIRNTSLRDGQNSIAVVALGDRLNYTDSEYSNIVTFTITKLATPSNVTISNNVLLFDQVEGALEYEVKVGTDVHTITTTTFNLDTLNLPTGSQGVSVRAIGNDYSTINSSLSEDITYQSGDNKLENLFKDLFTNFASSETNESEEE